MNQHNYERGNRILDEFGEWDFQRYPYGVFSGWIEPDGFRIMPVPKIMPTSKPIWRKLAEPEYLLNPERSGYRRVSNA